MLRGSWLVFDIEMAHLLAKTLRVTPEFVLLQKNEWKKVDAALNNGSCDIAMSGHVISPGRTQSVDFSVSYLDVTVGFIVKDYRRDQFSSWEIVRDQGAMKIGIPTESRYYRTLVESLMSEATFVPLRSPREFFREQGGDFDAMIFTAEAGAAWTLIYPHYSVVVPLPNPLVIPLAYPMPAGEQDLVDFVNAWIKLKKKDKTIDVLFNHWILGQGANEKEPRWSVIRNVLHWID